MSSYMYNFSLKHLWPTVCHCTYRMSVCLFSPTGSSKPLSAFHVRSTAQCCELLLHLRLHPTSKEMKKKMITVTFVAATQFQFCLHWCTSVTQTSYQASAVAAGPLPQLEALPLCWVKFHNSIFLPCNSRAEYPIPTLHQEVSLLSNMLVF